eukprot:TRINITY_DN33202_c0_g1_i2.p2 TRINITY_DN33202_c0_g1~~TRINITY_DN33202_c0_g1_i2.p2  ORF type:complete len:128 (+),score=19.92 TRINITY_DN33202_c0_g1_i2:145-528(+)
MDAWIPRSSQLQQARQCCFTLATHGELGLELEPQMLDADGGGMTSGTRKVLLEHQMGDYCTEEAAYATGTTAERARHLILSWRLRGAFCWLLRPRPCLHGTWRKEFRIIGTCPNGDIILSRRLSRCS